MKPNLREFYNRYRLARKLRRIGAERANKEGGINPAHFDDLTRESKQGWLAVAEEVRRMVRKAKGGQ